MDFSIFSTKVCEKEISDPGKSIGLPHLVCKNIRIYHECEVLIEKSVPRVTVWLCRVMPNCDPRDRFVNQYLKLMIYSFSCTPMGADTNGFIHIYLKYFAFMSAILILTSFNRFL